MRDFVVLCNCGRLVNISDKIVDEKIVIANELEIILNRRLTEIRLREELNILLKYLDEVKK